MDGKLEQRKISFLQAAQNVSTQFGPGLLLKTIEKGVRYPIVHIGIPTSNYDFEVETDKYDSRSSLINDTNLQGVYQQMAKVTVDLFGNALDDIGGFNNDPSVHWEKFYLVLGFHQLPFRPFTETTEINWKDWSLARYLFLNTPDDFGLSQITFYKRQYPHDYGLFLYMVILECSHIKPMAQLKLKDFTNRVRADKLPAYMALYQDAEGLAYSTSVTPDVNKCISLSSLSISPVMSSTPIRTRPQRQQSPPRYTSESPLLTPSSPPQRRYETRGTSPLPTPWFFMSHPQFLRRNQRNLQRSGDLDSVGESDSASLSISPELGRSTASPTTPLPYYYSWTGVQYDEF
ncbi:hypothetical protein CHUAL_009167 [Chamberlinius hualienensis]